MSAVNCFELIVLCAYVFSGLLGLGFGLVFWVLTAKNIIG